MLKDWIGNSNSAWYSLASSNRSEEEREQNDYYATDPKALDIFLKKIEQDKITLHKDIWKCACGEGHLSEELKKHGYNVWSTDLIDRGYGQGNLDFLKSIPNEWHGDILTNPPYKYAKEFVEKALEVSRYGCYTVMFLKIQFLEGQARQKLFKKYPPKYVYVNSKRQQCAKNGKFDKFEKGAGTAICYCWFI